MFRRVPLINKIEMARTSALEPLTERGLAFSIAFLFMIGNLLPMFLLLPLVVLGIGCIGWGTCLFTIDEMKAQDTKTIITPGHRQVTIVREHINHR